MRYIKYGILSISLLVMFVFIYSNLASKNKEDYAETPKQFVNYDNALRIANKVPLLINARTVEDFKEIEDNGKTYLTDELYKNYMSIKNTAGKHRKDAIKVESIKGTFTKGNAFKFKLVVTRNGYREVHIVTIKGGIITGMRSLGDV